MQQPESMQKNRPSVASHGGTITGIFFIVFGGLFLLGQSGIEIFGHSPWILFALLPVFGVLAAAWHRYQANGRQISQEVLMILLWGLFPFAFIVGGIFDLNFSLIVPLIFILMGLSFIIPALRK